MRRCHFFGERMSGGGERLDDHRISPEIGINISPEEYDATQGRAEEGQGGVIVSDVG